MLYFIYLLFRNGSKDEIVESNQNDTAVTNDEKETIGAEDIKTIRDESSNNSIIKTSSGRNLEENVIAVANNKYQLDDSIIGMYINFRNFRTRKKSCAITIHLNTTYSAYFTYHLPISRVYLRVPPAACFETAWSNFFHELDFSFMEGVETGHYLQKRILIVAWNFI